MPLNYMGALSGYGQRRPLQPRLGQPINRFQQQSLGQAAMPEGNNPSEQSSPVRAPAGNDPVSRQRLQQYLNMGSQLGQDGFLYPAGYPITQRPQASPYGSMYGL